MMNSSSPTRRAGALSRLSLVATAAAILLIGATPASGAAGVEVTADPSTISVGATTTITATGLGGLEQASFGLSDTQAGQFTESGGSSYEAPASGGTATATFSGLVEGTVTVAVGDGETVLGTVSVTVTAGGGGGDVTVTAAPSSLAVGETTTITASGLGGLETASFGLSDTAGGTFAPGGQSSAEASVTGGEASVEFTAAKAGTITIAVGDGETALGETTVTVTAAPSPAPTATATPTPAPTTADGPSPLVIVVIVVVALLIAAVIVLWVLLARRRRNARS